MRAAAISIDVDSLRFYREIHGLAPLDPGTADPIYSIALPRFFTLLERAGVPATLFAIGEDAPSHAEAFAPAKALGCELASHSFSHDYRLTKRSAEEIGADLRTADLALSRLSGAPIRGFRAPGYNVTPALLEAVRDLGYSYDSSLLPAPAYFAARGAAIAGYALAGRRSRSIPGDVRQFLGPLDPYWFDPNAAWQPVTQSSDALLELPMAVEPLTRTPLIGTSWAILPESARRVLLSRSLAKLPLFNFELHAIDLLDHTDAPVLAELAAHQPDLRRSASDKIAAFHRLFHRLRQDREVATLASIAARWRPARSL